MSDNDVIDSNITVQVDDVVKMPNDGETIMKVSAGTQLLPCDLGTIVIFPDGEGKLITHTGEVKPLTQSGDRCYTLLVTYNLESSDFAVTLGKPSRVNKDNPIAVDEPETNVVKFPEQK